jgi:hypothetical protein
VYTNGMECSHLGSINFQFNFVAKHISFGPNRLMTEIREFLIDIVFGSGLERLRQDA